MEWDNVVIHGLITAPFFILPLWVHLKGHPGVPVSQFAHLWRVRSCCEFIFREADQKGPMVCPTNYRLLLFISKEIQSAWNGRDLSRRRTWDLSSLLQTSSATVHSTGSLGWLLLAVVYRHCGFKSGVYKCSLLYWYGNPVLSQKHETWFMCLGSHRTEIKVSGSHSGN